LLLPPSPLQQHLRQKQKEHDKAQEVHHVPCIHDATADAGVMIFHAESLEQPFKRLQEADTCQIPQQ
jgi:hypothetical protein